MGSWNASGVGEKSWKGSWTVKLETSHKNMGVVLIKEVSLEACWEVNAIMILSQDCHLYTRKRR